MPISCTNIHESLPIIKVPANRLVDQARRTKRTLSARIEMQRPFASVALAVAVVFLCVCTTRTSCLANTHLTVCTTLYEPFTTLRSHVRLENLVDDATNGALLNLTELRAYFRGFDVDLVTALAVYVRDRPDSCDRCLKSNPACKLLHARTTQPAARNAEAMFACVHAGVPSLRTTSRSRSRYGATSMPNPCTARESENARWRSGPTL